MIIYLADLSHTGQGRSPNTVPLAPGFLASVARKNYPDLDITIFRNPHFFFHTVKSKKPDLVGFSVYTWSEMLSDFYARKVKEISPEIVTVAGGPSVDDVDEELINFIKTFSNYDIVIPNEGEVSFVRLIEHLRDYDGRLIPDITIDGCVRLTSDGTILRGKYSYPSLVEIPSPYLEGFMDPFLKDGYLPLLQTMRGCPYSCTYCCSGSKSWSKLRAFDLDTVIAEFDYIREHTQSNYLFVTDENFGIFKERDVKLAQHIRSSYERTKYPAFIDSYTDKRVTDDILKIKEIMHPMRDFNVSFQTLNDSARESVKRKNIEIDDFVKCIQWAKKRNIDVTTEMIFGFPYETVESFTSGLEWLIKVGLSRISAYELRILKGSDLFTKASRERFNFRTKFRLMERTFGVYEKTVVAEMEEIVVGANTFDFDGFLKVRRYGFFFFLMFARKYFSELIKMMVKLDLPGEKLVMYIADYDYGKKLKLNSIVEEYTRRIRDELFENPKEGVRHTSALIAEQKQVPATKLNLIYSGKIMFDAEARRELFDVIEEFLFELIPEKNIIAFFVDYLENVLIKQVIDFGGDEDPAIDTQTYVDTEKIEKGEYSTVDELITNQKITLQLSLDTQVLKYLEKRKLQNMDDELAMEDIFMANSPWLKRNRRVIGVVSNRKESKGIIVN